MRWFSRPAVLLVGLLLGSFPYAAAAAPEQPGVQLTVIRSAPGSVVVALDVAQYQIEAVDPAGEGYQRVLIPATTPSMAPGAPQVPTRGALVGLAGAAGAAPEASLRVLEADCEMLAPYRLYPAPALAPANDDMVPSGTSQMVERFAPDDAIYDADAFWPAEAAELASTGYLRDQAVAQIEFYPVQHNPLRRAIRVCRRIVVEVNWHAEAQVAAAVGDQQVSPAFEGLMHDSLLNYASLGRPAAYAGPAGGPVAPTPGLAAAVSAGPVLKIGVAQDGMYKLTYTDLSNARFNPAGIDPRTIRITNRGAEVPIYVTGEGDGRFDPGDLVLFYGQAIHDAYTTTNVYWLDAGAVPGRRMAQRDGTPSGTNIPAYFPALQHAEEDTAYWQVMPSTTGEDRWFWGGRLSPSTQGMPTFRDYTVHLGSVSPAAATAQIRARLKGYTGLGHRTRIWLNGNPIGDQAWQGQVQFDQVATTAQGALLSGDNVIRVETLDAGAAVDQLLVNWIEIAYLNRYVAENDRLAFGAPAAGSQRFEITGFANGVVGVLDVSDPANPVVIANAVVTPAGSTYKLAFNDTAGAGSRYLALSATGYLSPASIELDQPSAWKSPANGADYIIITHPEFYDQAVALANYRRAAGLRVATVKVDDLYDEFNDGIFNPGAIRDFLKYAYENWARPAPAYVLLLGDADQDYKDNLHNGTRNYVPSQNIESSLFGEVSSDNWFVTVSGPDNLPDMFIGRLVAQTPQEANTMVTKVINYERNAPDGSWNTRALFVADDDDPDFRATADQLARHLPYYYAVDKVYANAYPPGDPHAAILKAINAGRLLVTYVGHGEYFGWGRWNANQAFMFQASDMPALTNVNKLPVVVVGDCLNGFFAGPKDSSALAEVLLRRENAGAVAVWAPTELGYALGHRILLDEFYRALFERDQVTLGAATTAAKIATYGQSSFWGELVATYVLFGDPATRVGMPPNFPYLRSVAPANGSAGSPVYQPLQVVFSKSMDPGTVTVSGPAGATFSASWNTDFTVLSAAHADFAHDTRYQITVRGRDRAGNALGTGIVPNPWAFTTTADVIPPGVTLSIPGANPSAALTTSPLRLAFSEPVRPESVTYTIVPSMPGTLTWSSDHRTAWFTHQRFRQDEIYTFSVLTAKDVAGNALAQPANLTFSVLPTRYWYYPHIGG